MINTVCHILYMGIHIERYNLPKQLSISYEQNRV